MFALTLVLRRRAARARPAGFFSVRLDTGSARYMGARIRAAELVVCTSCERKSAGLQMCLDDVCRFQPNTVGMLGYTPTFSLIFSSFFLSSDNYPNENSQKVWSALLALLTEISA